MRFLERIAGRPAPGPMPTFAEAEPAPAPVAVFGAESSPSSKLLDTARGTVVARELALSIPSVRKAQAVIAGTIATFDLGAWDTRTGQRLPVDDARARWMTQPEQRRSRYRTLARTLQDVIWHDRAVWRIVDRTLYGTPTAFERIHPDRVQTIDDPLDPDVVGTWIIDGQETPESSLVVFDGAGLGGMRRYGAALLNIYADLQAAAGNYARTPAPAETLVNEGEDLKRPEIEELLDEWEEARATRSVAYRNRALKLEQSTGWSARELQLTEAREHAALEVARLFGLPAFALDATGGESMTYANVASRRRDLVEALRPWMSVVEETLSLDDRAGRRSGTLLPAGVVARFDSTAYTRDDPLTRMQTWNAALERNVLTLPEVRSAEPLAQEA